MVQTRLSLWRLDLKLALPTLEGLDVQALEAETSALLEVSADWPSRQPEAGIRVGSGWSPAGGPRAYRTEVDLAAPAADVARFIADDMVERLPQWSREFVDGEAVRTLEFGPEYRAWLMRVRYATPWPLADREYVFYLSRRTAPGGTESVAYQSVVPESEPRSGVTRAELHATVHRVVPTGESSCRLEHVLRTDLGGRLPGWVQSYVFRGGIEVAQIRDAQAQRTFFSHHRESA